MARCITSRSSVLRILLLAKTRVIVMLAMTEAKVMQMQKARGIMKLVEAQSQLTLRSGQRCSIRRFEV